jgi:protein-disulfide isomerase
VAMNLRASDLVSYGVQGFLVLCAATITVMVIWRPPLPPPPRPSGDSVGAAQPDWRDFSVHGQRIGPSAARAVVVVFSDYFCPYCREMEARFREARKKYPRDFAVVYRNWPLTGLHPAAFDAALASECGARQGRFEAIHADLFELRNGTTVVWREVGARAGVADVRAFAECMVSDSAKRVVQRDVDAASKLGARGTPLILMNGRRYPGTISAARLDSLIKSVLRESDTSDRAVR